jgi:hypothetical protein
MQNWLSEVLIFVAGSFTGIALVLIGWRLSAVNKRRRDLSGVRRRILAGIKQSHDQEVLDEAFRATEALRNELFKSLLRLRNSMNVLLTDEESKPANSVAEKPEGSSRP